MSLSKLAYDTIKHNIVAGKLPPGLILEVAPLARILSVSRTTVSSALETLLEEEMLSLGDGRGYTIGTGNTAFRREISETDLVLPKTYEQSVTQRSWRSKFYPKVEEEIAACLLFGQFAINASRLAEHYGVSRTIAHETLVRLERLGLVRQESSRWLAGRMTPEELKAHYEMRWILEPAALKSAAGRIDKAVVTESFERAQLYGERPRSITVERLNRLERDLHIDIVLQCESRPMAEAIHRSQLPLIATNISLSRAKGLLSRQRAHGEHLLVLAKLSEGRINDAAEALEAHLRSSFTAVEPLLNDVKGNWNHPPYMVQQK